MAYVRRVSVDMKFPIVVEEDNTMPPGILREVKSYMEFWGWTNGGGPGAMKFDVDNKIIAHHGDATWIADVENACNTISRLADRANEEGSNND